MKQQRTKLKQKNENGITLIALVITIIVLLILAGVTINLTLGDNGIFKVAEQAARNYKDAENKELGLLGDFSIELETNFEYDAKKGVNKPKTYNTGLVPVTINEETGATTPVTDTTTNWYSYDGITNQWANAKTADNSLWVWIPRYAYKITYTDESNKSAGGTIDVVFLKGITNLDKNGKDVTASNYVDEKGNTGAYIVHPAFKDGRSNGFANGEWDEEITGFWVAKFEAGYAGTLGDATTAQDSNVNLSVVSQWNGTDTVELLTNYYGSRAVGDAIKYPVFQPSRPGMNNLGISDAYDLCRSLTASGNPYELKSIDSHMTKNSEWGAITYLSYSKYGRNGTEVTINNVSAENENTINGVTGYAGATVNAEINKKILAEVVDKDVEGSWTTEQGKKASSTGNIYGIYDLSGGLFELVSAYIETEEDSYLWYGISLHGESTKYKTKYVGTSSQPEINYAEIVNDKIIGDGIVETSIEGTGFSSWNNDYSHIWFAGAPFLMRGGGYKNNSNAGIFAFYYMGGNCNYIAGFRAVLIP